MCYVDVDRSGCSECLISSTSKPRSIPKRDHAQLPKVCVLCGVCSWACWCSGESEAVSEFDIDELEFFPEGVCCARRLCFADWRCVAEERTPSGSIDHGKVCCRLLLSFQNASVA